MTKRELTEKTDAVVSQTHDALQTLYHALPPGQQKTVLKNAEVKALMERYGVVPNE